MKSNKELLGILKTLDRLNKDFENNKLRVFSSNRIHNSRFLFFRYIVECDELKKYSLRDIVINYFNKVENFFPGSSFILSKEIVNKFFYSKSLFKQKTKAVKNNYSNLEKFFKNLVTEDTTKTVLDILEMSGPDSTIHCKKYSGNEILVVKKNSSTFDVSIEEDLINVYFNKVKQSTKNLQTCVLDAYIERESEIIPLIDYASLHKIPVLIFCRGISKNAIKALKQIIVRNNIYVYPYVVKFQNNDPFLLKDIAKALDINILSAETGDSIYKDIVSKSKLKELKLSSNRIEIKDPNQKEVKEIIRKINDTKDDKLKKYLLKRKARFSSNITEVLIPSNKIENLNEIKNLIRCYNHAAAYGFVEYNTKIYSKSCIENCTLIAESMFQTLSDIKLVILSKKEN